MLVGFASNIRLEGGDALPSPGTTYIHPHLRLRSRERQGACSPLLSSTSPASFVLLLIELFFPSLVFAVSN